MSALPRPATRTLDEVIIDHVTKTLHEHRWNIGMTAGLLDIGRATLYRLIRRYKIPRPDYREWRAVWNEGRRRGD